MFKTPDSEKSYITISEGTTTDTSMYEDDEDITNDSLHDSNASIYSVPDASMYTNVTDDMSNSAVRDNASTALNPSNTTSFNLSNDSEDLDMNDSMSDDNESDYITDDGEDEEMNEDEDEETDEQDGETDEETFFTLSVENTFTDSEIEISDVSYESGSTHDSVDINSSTDSIDDTNLSSETRYETNMSSETRHASTNTRQASTTSDGDLNEWVVTETSVNVPAHEREWTGVQLLIARTLRSSQFGRLFNISVRVSKRNNINRDRSWSLEECAICFDVMLKDQSLYTLPCAHNFHVQCIGPWLQEKQTCPVCRKPAE